VRSICSPPGRKDKAGQRRGERRIPGQACTLATQSVPSPSRTRDPPCHLHEEPSTRRSESRFPTPWPLPSKTSRRNAPNQARRDARNPRWLTAWGAEAPHSLHRHALSPDRSTLPLPADSAGSTLALAVADRLADKSSPAGATLRRPPGPWRAGREGGREGGG
jgi:hypothetical protein